MSTGCFIRDTLGLFSRIFGRIPDIRQNRLTGYPAAGYPANSVSGATLDIRHFNQFFQGLFPYSFFLSGY